MPRALVLAALAALVPAASLAQLIGLRTIPVASGDQFLVLPSQRRGMGDVSIAVADALGDPFTNAAKGARVTGARIFGSPTYYTIAGGNGEARTLPVGALFGAGRWFGGVSLALQQLQAGTSETLVG